MCYQKFVTTFLHCLTLLCILVLAACDTTNIGQQGATPTSSSTPVLGDLTPKGPGSAALTATALATPVTITCQLPSTTAVSTQSWQMYTDPHYPFRLSFPPGWKVGQTTISSAGDSTSSYEVMILPPTGRLPVVEESGITEPEYISLSIILTGPANVFSNESSWTVEAAPILVSHVSTKLSYRFSPDCGELNTATDPVRLGQHPYSFYLESRDQANKTKDTQIFLSIVQSFSYTGA